MVLVEPNRIKVVLKSDVLNEPLELVVADTIQTILLHQHRMGGIEAIAGNSINGGIVPLTGVKDALDALNDASRAKTVNNALGNLKRENVRMLAHCLNTLTQN